MTRATERMLLTVIAGVVLTGYSACVRPPRSAANGNATGTADAVAPSTPGDLLSPDRIAALPSADREAWTRYMATSSARRAAERAAMDAELKAAGKRSMTRAPYDRQSFDLTARMTDDWFRTDSARRLADNILSFQTPSGGWSKHVDFTQRPRQPGESYYSESDGWSYIATIDNGSTTAQIRFLGRAQAALPDERYRTAFLRGLDYLLDAQFPTGCWPQVYPLQGGYHDAATFNDDAIVNVLKVFRDVERGRFEFVSPTVRDRVARALGRGIDCLIASQVVVDGRRTGWAQQHDPLTLRPVAGRSYEPAALSGRESAGVTGFLMSLSQPDPRIIESVHAAVVWFRKTQIHGYVYDFETGLKAQPGAGPIWARMYEIGTDRPVFSNRDGVILYNWNELTDRRQGYGWFGSEPVDILTKYDETWAPRYPRRPTSVGTSGCGARCNGEEHT